MTGHAVRIRRQEAVVNNDRVDKKTPVSIAVHDCWNRIGVSGDASCPELRQHVHCHNCPVYSAAARTLLQRELPEGYLQDATVHFAQKKVLEEEDAQSVVIFRIGPEWMALPTIVFQEITDGCPLHSLPHHRGGALLGLANVRGELLLCASLAKLLGVEEDSAAKQGAASRRMLVIRYKGWRLIFPVDEVFGIHRHTRQDLKKLPETVSKAENAYTKTAFAWRNLTVGCLDEELLFQALNRSVL
jgi:chemotaxis-related protein WspD